MKHATLKISVSCPSLVGALYLTMGLPFSRDYFSQST